MQRSVLGFLKRIPGSIAALCLTCLDFLLIFTAICCGDSFSQHWRFELENAKWGWQHLLLVAGDIHNWTNPSQFLTVICGGGTSLLHTLAAPTSLMWLFLLILSYRRAKFSKTSGGSQGWMFYNLIVILKWMLEETSPVVTYSAILTAS